MIAQSITITTPELAVGISIIAAIVSIIIYVVRMEIKDYVKTSVSDSGKDQSKFRKEIYDKMDSDREKFSALMSRVDRDITTLQLTQNSTGEKMETLERSVEKLDTKVDGLLVANSDQTRLLQEIVAEMRAKK